ncbi:GFA family protein [Motiliproteus sp.]|uniref:GFA family protein n=1 Tax=Motiliproteus sp. TaxID=1898955 RepID=UPI003BA87206
MNKPIEGSCLCGALRYQASGHLDIFQYCHCSRCRKFTGSAHAANLFVQPEHFQWLSSTETLGRFEPDNSRYFATSFCKTCGSSMPWIAKGGKVVVIPAGTLDQVPDIRPSQNIFCNSRAEWYRSAAELPEYDQLPPRR